MLELYNLFNVMVEGFSVFYDFLFLPVNDFLLAYPSAFADFLYNLLTFVGLGAWLSTVTFGGFLFGGTLLVVLVIIVIYFFIP